MEEERQKEPNSKKNNQKESHKMTVTKEQFIKILSRDLIENKKAK